MRRLTYPCYFLHMATVSLNGLRKFIVRVKSVELQVLFAKIAHSAILFVSKRMRTHNLYITSSRRCHLRQRER